MDFRENHRLGAGLASLLLIGALGCATGASGVRDGAADVPAPPVKAAAPGDDAEPPANTLRWKTASEVDNFGFDVYRADSEDGPFEKITERPIAGAGTVDVPTQYAYVDDTIERGREYFYYVESISMQGERARFTPVMRAAAKK